MLQLGHVVRQDETQRRADSPADDPARHERVKDYYRDKFRKN